MKDFASYVFFIDNYSIVSSIKLALNMFFCYLVTSIFFKLECRVDFIKKMVIGSLISKLFLIIFQENRKSSNRKNITILVYLNVFFCKTFENDVKFIRNTKKIRTKNLKNEMEIIQNIKRL